MLGDQSTLRRCGRISRIVHNTPRNFMIHFLNVNCTTETKSCTKHSTSSKLSFGVFKKLKNVKFAFSCDFLVFSVFILYILYSNLSCGSWAPFAANPGLIGFETKELWPDEKYGKSWKTHFFVI